jgi:hypothetical protein
VSATAIPQPTSAERDERATSRIVATEIAICRARPVKNVKNTSRVTIDAAHIRRVHTGFVNAWTRSNVFQRSTWRG